MSPLWELVVGVLLAVVGLSVIPWMTSAATSWLEARRGDRQHRRELYERWMLARLASSSSKTLDHTELDRELNESTWLLDAQFGPADSDVREAIGPQSYARLMSSEQQQILQWWALGHQRQAKKAAKKINAERRSKG